MTLKWKNLFALLLVGIVLAVNVGVMFAQDTATEEVAAEEGEVLGGIAAEESAAADSEATVVDEASDGVTAEEGQDTAGAEPGTVDVEASAENETGIESATGLGTFFLLIGLLGVVAVGVVFLARDSYKPDADAE